MFQRISKKVGFRVTAKMYSRYVVTTLDEQGRSLKEIGRYLGHTRPTTTEHYIARSAKLNAECAEVMGGMV